MFKFAMIMNVPGESPATYSGTFSNEDGSNLFVGTSDVEMAAGFVEELARDGIDLINLCGDFDDVATQRFIDISQGKTRVFNAGYFPEELAKLEALSSLKEYGFISIARGIEQMERIELLGEECNARIILIKDLDMACDAARELVENGIGFIELCSWFDEEKTRAVIDAVSGKVPVGSCGPMQ